LKQLLTPTGLEHLTFDGTDPSELGITHLKMPHRRAARHAEAKTARLLFLDAGSNDGQAKDSTQQDQILIFNYPAQRADT
jgi:hypothetical protein